MLLLLADKRCTYYSNGHPMENRRKYMTVQWDVQCLILDRCVVIKTVKKKPFCEPVNLYMCTIALFLFQGQKRMKSYLRLNIFKKMQSRLFSNHQIVLSYPSRQLILLKYLKLFVQNKSVVVCFCKCIVIHFTIYICVYKMNFWECKYARSFVIFYLYYYFLKEESLPDTVRYC